MSPLIRRGDNLYLSVFQKSQSLKKFHIYVYKDQFGNNVVHRYIKQRNDQFLFRGDNNTHFDRFVSVGNIIYKLEKIERESVVIERTEFLFKILSIFSFLLGLLRLIYTNLKLFLCALSVKSRGFNFMIAKFHSLIVLILRGGLKLLIPKSSLRFTRGRSLWISYELLSDLDFILIAPQHSYRKVRLFIKLYINITKLYPILGEINFIPLEELDDFKKYGTFKQKISFDKNLAIKNDIDYFMIAVEVYSAFKSINEQLKAFQLKKDLNIKNKYEIIKSFIDLLRLDESLGQSLYISRENYIDGTYKFSIEAHNFYKRISSIDRNDFIVILNIINDIEFNVLNKNINKNVNFSKSYFSLNLLKCLDKKSMMTQDEEHIVVTSKAEVFLDKYSDMKYLDVPDEQRIRTLKFYKTNYFTFFDILGNKEKISVCIEEFNKIMATNDNNSHFIKEILSNSNYNQLR